MRVLQDDGPGAPDERIYRAAVRHVPTGRVGVAHTHWDATDELLHQGVCPEARSLADTEVLSALAWNKFFNELEDGWITSRGRFVVREEGEQIIRAAKQYAPGASDDIHASDVDYREEARALVAVLLCEAPAMPVLKRNARRLTVGERVKVKAAARAHGGGKSMAPHVWKAVVDGRTWYVTSTHRAFTRSPTLRGAVKAWYNEIEQTG